MVGCDAFGAAASGRVRILHVAATYLPAVRYGGTIVSVHGLGRALAARGHDVHVFTTSVDGAGDSAVPLATPVDVDGVKVWYYQSPFLRRLYWSPDMGRALARQIAGFDIAHLHAMFVWPVWAAARAARRSGVPYVVSPRGMLERSLMAQKNRLMKSAVMAAVGTRMLERAAAIHVTSSREAREASAFGLALPAVYEVPNGVDLVDLAVNEVPSAAVAAVLQGPPFLLFLGRISWKKGLDRLIAALPHVPHVRLVIAGSDEESYSQTLQARLDSTLAERVHFVGQLGDVDKAALLKHAAALVLPSYSENFGNVVLEAMSAGCPVVVTPEVGTADIVRTSGAGLVLDGDPATLGPGLASLCADARLRETMRAAGPGVARRYSWAAAAEQIERVYQMVAA